MRHERDKENMSPKSDQFKNVGQLRRGKSKYSIEILVRPQGGGVAENSVWFALLITWTVF